jgi:hypothetical protein
MTQNMQYRIKTVIIQNRYRMAFLIQNWYRILSTEYIQNMYRKSSNVSVYSTE